MKRIKPFLYTLLFLTVFIPSRHPPSIDADTLPIQKPIETNKEQATRLIKQYSALYHVSEREMYETVKYETGGTFDPSIQSGYYYKGIREESYGLAQINLPSHTNITKEQAKDPVFAIKFMASEFALGHCTQWTGWRILKNEGII